MCTCMHLCAPASSWLSYCPLSMLQYQLMRFPTLKGCIPAHTQPAWLCSCVLALGHMYIGRSDLLRARQTVEADCWGQLLVCSQIGFGDYKQGSVGH